MQQQRGVSQVSALMEKAAAGRERSEWLCVRSSGHDTERAIQHWGRKSLCLPAWLLDGWMDAHAWPDLNGHVKGWRRHIYLWIISANSAANLLWALCFYSLCVRFGESERDECKGRLRLREQDNASGAEPQTALLDIAFWRQDLRWFSALIENTLAEVETFFLRECGVLHTWSSQAQLLFLAAFCSPSTHGVGCHLFLQSPLKFTPNYFYKVIWI
jgi:hypothetical protein